MSNNTNWVGTWTVAPAPAEGVAFSNVTVRMNGRVSLGGSVRSEERRVGKECW